MHIDTPVTQIMEGDPVTVELTQGLAEVHRALSSERFHHLPVVEDGKLVGMISTTDLLKHSLYDGEASNAFIERHLTIADVMRKDVIAIGDRATLGEAAMALSAGGFHALPVVDHDNRLRGLVTSTDLIASLLAAPERPPPETSPERIKLLEAVLKAAEIYLRSGLAETEHARLERAIEAAKERA